MKKLTLVSVALFCFVMPVVAQKDETKQQYKEWLTGSGTVLNGGYEFDGSKYRYDLGIRDFAGTPKWEPSDGKAPLSPDEAYKIACEALKDLVGNLDSWSAHSINLHKIPDVSDGWYFKVSFFYVNANVRRPGLDIIVKLDGKAIPPKLVSDVKETPQQ